MSYSANTPDPSLPSPPLPEHVDLPEDLITHVGTGDDTIALALDLPEYETHPLAALLPEMSPEEFANLRASIRERGILQDITLYHGKILDGRHRYTICRELGILPRFVEYHGTDPSGYSLDLNLARRHLTQGQKALLVLPALAAAEQITGDRRRAGKHLAPAADLLVVIPEGMTARDFVAKRYGVNAKYLSDAKRLAEDAPDLATSVRCDQRSLTAALRILKKREAAQLAEDLAQRCPDDASPAQPAGNPRGEPLEATVVAASPAPLSDPHHALTPDLEREIDYASETLVATPTPADELADGVFAVDHEATVSDAAADSATDQAKDDRGRSHNSEGPDALTAIRCLLRDLTREDRHTLIGALSPDGNLAEFVLAGYALLDTPARARVLAALSDASVLQTDTGRARIPDAPLAIPAC